jgi:hypothetical protein
MTCRRPLSDLAWRVLGYAAQGVSLYVGCRTRSEVGGRERVVMALMRRGYIAGRREITAAGRAALTERECGL